MKTAPGSLSLLVAFTVLTATGCELLRPSHRPSSGDPQKLLDWGIRQYNTGKAAEARETLESVVETTQSREQAETRAVAHFYLAAVAWDFGEKARTDLHLKQCLALRPNYEPDWTFFAPSLRERYDALR